MAGEKHISFLNEEIYRTFFDSSLDAMLVLDENGKIIEMNQCACEAANGLRDKMIGRAFELIVAPDFRANVSTAFRELKTNEVFTGELHLMGKYGLVVPIEWRACRAINGFTIWSGRDITERINREVKIQTEVTQKELMLREANHRMKNNFQFLYSLLNLQARVSDDKVGEILREYSHRIRTIALINSDLSEKENYETEIELSGYLTRLAKNLLAAYRGQTDRIRLAFHCSPVMISINSAIPYGLILNEVISNSLKYAFVNDGDGEIKLSLHQNHDNIIFHLSDNGSGFSETAEIDQSKTLGMRLIHMLVAQLDGTLEISGKYGAHFHITIPNERKMPSEEDRNFIDRSEVLESREIESSIG